MFSLRATRQLVLFLFFLIICAGVFVELYFYHSTFVDLILFIILFLPVISILGQSVVQSKKNLIILVALFFSLFLSFCIVISGRVTRSLFSLTGIVNKGIVGYAAWSGYPMNFDFFVVLVFFISPILFFLIANLIYKKVERKK